MENLALLRRFFAFEMIALNPKNVILGALVQEIIRDEYLPKLKRELERTREDDVSKRNKIEKAIKLWKDSAKSDEWNNKAVAIIRNISNDHRVTADEAEEAAQEIAVNIYDGDKKFYNMLYDHDPIHGPDGSKGLMGLWSRAINFRTLNYFRKLMKEKAFTTHKVNMVMDDEGKPHNPLDDVSSGVSEAESGLQAQEVKRIIRGLHTEVPKDRRVKDSETSIAVFNAWMDALDKIKNRIKQDGLSSLSRIKLKRDVAPAIKREYDIGHPQIMQLYRKNVLPAMAKYLAGEFTGNEAYFRKLLKASKRNATERIAQEFYEKEIKAWVAAPALRIQEALKNYAEV